MYTHHTRLLHMAPMNTYDKLQAHVGQATGHMQAKGLGMKQLCLINALTARVHSELVDWYTYQLT